ncbi:MAG TPA: hypothetical protein VK400_08115 [Pyrinomonadaceae bacterium]|nr:hypothetical protein [Pyrinomonadaceae bacterium]
MFEKLQRFRGQRRAAVLLAAVILCCLAASCGGPVGGGNNGAGTPSGASCSPYGFAAPFGTPSGVSSNIPPTRMGAICLTGQSFRGTSSTALDFQGFRDSTAVCIPDGVFTFSAQGVNPNDGSCSGPVSPAVTVNFAVDYVGDMRRDPVCVQSSRVDYRSFTVTGTPLDTQVAAAAREAILAELDFQVATAFNNSPFGSRTPIERGKERCGGWTANATRPTPTP